MPRPRNVNDKFRTLDTRQVRSVRDMEGLPKAEDMAAIEEERRKRRSHMILTVAQKLWLAAGVLLFSVALLPW